MYITRTVILVKTIVSSQIDWWAQVNYNVIANVNYVCYVSRYYVSLAFASFLVSNKVTY